MSSGAASALAVAIRPGEDGVGGDPGRGELERDGLGEPDQAFLGGAVAGLLVCPTRRHAADVDDPPPAALEHSRQHRTGRVEGARQVHLDVVIPRRRLEAQRAADLVEHARVVHEDVDARHTARSPRRPRRRRSPARSRRRPAARSPGPRVSRDREAGRCWSTATTRAPSRRSAATMARPSPPAAPVTSATVTRRCLRCSVGEMRSRRSRRLRCRCPRR